MTDFQQTINSKKLTLVDFFATWCGPCKMQSPIIHDLKEAVGDSVNILKVDVDQNQDAAAMYNVRSIPTLVIFREGKELWRGVGVHQKSQLQEILNRF